jgi:hypothetical protein
MPVNAIQCFTAGDECDLTTSFLKCVDYVREARPVSELEVPNAAGKDVLSRKRPFHTYDDIPWGWAATKVAELLQSYPSGLTSVILRCYLYEFATLNCNVQ